MSKEAFFIAAQATVGGGPIPVAEGQPGTGKTRTTEALARAVGRKLYCLKISEHDPCEINGFYVPKGDAIIHGAPPWVDALRKCPKGGFLLLDEVGDGSPAQQSACHQLLTHSQELLPGVMIAATGNPPDQATNGYERRPAFVNRICVLEWPTDTRSWMEAAAAGFPDPKVPVLPDSWQKFISDERNMCLAYFQVQSQKAQVLPKEASNQCNPWPSQRSWTNAWILMGAARSVNASEAVMHDLTKGCVGDGATGEFWKWRKSLNLPDPEVLLKKPSKFKLPDKIDVLYAVLGSVVSAVLENNTPERWQAAAEICERAADKYLDVAVSQMFPLAREENQPKDDKGKKLIELSDFFMEKVWPRVRDCNNSTKSAA